MEFIFNNFFVNTNYSPNFFFIDLYNSNFFFIDLYNYFSNFFFNFNFTVVVHVVVVDHRTYLYYVFKINVFCCFSWFLNTLYENLINLTYIGIIHYHLIGNFFLFFFRYYNKNTYIVTDNTCHNFVVLFNFECSHFYQKVYMVNNVNAVYVIFRYLFLNTEFLNYS